MEFLVAHDEIEDEMMTIVECSFPVGSALQRERATCGAGGLTGQSKALTEILSKERAIIQKITARKAAFPEIFSRKAVDFAYFSFSLPPYLRRSGAPTQSDIALHGACHKSKGEKEKA